MPFALQKIGFLASLRPYSAYPFLRESLLSLSVIEKGMRVNDNSQKAALNHPHSLSKDKEKKEMIFPVCLC